MAAQTSSGINEVVRWILGIMFAIILGSYGFAWNSTVALEDRVSQRLQRIEDKVDRLIERR